MPDNNKLKKGIAYLENRGYSVKVGDTCTTNQDYTAGDDPMRANELLDFIEDDSIDAIFCARGGFGSMKLLRMLDYELIREKRKLLTGFSDITALQWGIFAKTGVPSISGMLPAVDFCSSDLPHFFENAFWQLIETGKLDVVLPNALTTINHQEETDLKGVCMPGTLSLITKLLATPFFPNLEHSLLILEDIGEQKHKLEGYLEQLSLSGVFQQAKAILLGTFTEAEKEEYSEVPTEKELLKRVFRNSPRPVLNSFPYGHILEKLSLPLGVSMQVSLGKQTHLQTLINLFD
jgi:muramoyltetrapeptide carboxypeptidase